MSNRHLLRITLALTTLAAIGLASGCGGQRKLETGYTYRPLNSNELERRAYYLDTFSYEAVKAQQQDPRAAFQRQPGQR